MIMHTSADWIDRWHNEAERNIRIILEDFRGLNNDQLNYSSHIKQCSIMEILLNLSGINEQILCRIESEETKIPVTKEFGISAPRMFIIRNIRHFKCRKGNIRYQISQNVFEMLISQQERLRSILKSTTADLNRKINLFRLFGILKLSLGELIALLMLCQWQHIIQARRILMLN